MKLAPILILGLFATSTSLAQVGPSGEATQKNATSSKAAPTTKKPERQSEDPIQSPTNDSEKTPKANLDDHWRFAIGLGYILNAPAARFEDITYTNTSGPIVITGEGELKYDPTFQFSLEGRLLPMDDWGFVGGLNYEGEREFDSGKLSGSGTTIELSAGSDPSKVQFTTLYGSAVYRWNTFYLPFGLNYSIVKFTPAGGSTSSNDEKGGIGAQLGAGWATSDHLAIELYSWVTAMKLKSISGTETVDYGNGIFPSLRFNFKYVF